MTDPTDPIPPTDPAAEPAGGPAEAAPAATAEAPLPEAEVAKWKDLALRSQAELENFRKRMNREAVEVRRFAAASLVEDLLPVLDNFDFGLEAARAESASSSITLGMTMVRKQLDDFLAAQGVREIETEGQVLDPTRHHAVKTEVRPDLPEGTILQVVRKGYFLHDRVLRAPNVVVSAQAEPATAG